MTYDLLPCPFCGSTNLYYEHERPQGYICCSECGAEGPCDGRPADETGRLAWNRRTALAAPVPGELTDEELLKAWDAPQYEPLSNNDVLMGLRDVIAADRARWGRPMPLPSGEVERG